MVHSLAMKATLFANITALTWGSRESQFDVCTLCKFVLCVKMRNTLCRSAQLIYTIRPRPPLTVLQRALLTAAPSKAASWNWLGLCPHSLRTRDDMHGKLCWPFVRTACPASTRTVWISEFCITIGAPTLWRLSHFSVTSRTRFDDSGLCWRPDAGLRKCPSQASGGHTATARLCMAWHATHAPTCMSEAFLQTCNQPAVSMRRTEP